MVTTVILPKGLYQNILYAIKRISALLTSGSTGIHMTDIRFYFESNDKHGYVGVIEKSPFIKGEIVSQNAGSTNPGIYYQVGGGGLNSAFSSALGSQVKVVNQKLVSEYNSLGIGSGSWEKDSSSPPNPLPLTSLLVPINPDDEHTDKTSAMMYSVGPVLNSSGLVAAELASYTRIYTDAMTRIANSDQSFAGFRITLLSSGIYRGGAPIGPFADSAAGAVIDAITSSVKSNTAKLGGLSILINTDDYPMKRHSDKKLYPKERIGFTNAAVARNATDVTWGGFTISV